MDEDNRTPDQIRNEVGNVVCAKWRDALEAASEDWGANVAMTGMLTVTLEALKSAMGNEAAGEMLAQIAEGVRAGKEITISIGGTSRTDH